MDGVIRYLARDALAESLKQAMAKNEPGMWVRAADFDEHQAQGKQREVALQDRLTAVEQQLDERSGTCEWTDEDGVGTWHSACGVVWSFHEEGPAENGMNYCHSCGKAVAVKVADEAAQQEAAPAGWVPCSPEWLNSGGCCATAPRWSSKVWDGHSHWHPANKAVEDPTIDPFTVCLECFGSGTICTGIEEASSTICNKCDGTGTEKK